MRIVWVVALVMLAIACAEEGSSSPAAPAGDRTQPPPDAQHKGVIGPHGDHTPQHGGMVLMNGDIHYEVVLAANGRHQVWFSDAMRNELPASVASGVTLEIARPGAALETVALAIDDVGEAWGARARPLEGDGIMVKVRYLLQGTPHEIEVPFASGRD